jgi:hypothetical protein
MELVLKAQPLLSKSGEVVEDAEGNTNYLQHDAWAMMMLLRAIDGLTQAPHMRTAMKLHDVFMEAWIGDAESIELDDESVTTLKALVGEPKGKFREDSTLLSDFTVQRTLVDFREALGI